MFNPKKHNAFVAMVEAQMHGTPEQEKAAIRRYEDFEENVCEECGGSGNWRTCLTCAEAIGDITELDELVNA